VNRISIFVLAGGSDACLAAIKDGHREVGLLLKTTAGRAQLVALFNLCNPTALSDEENQEVFEIGY
jgi:hypothetical protein